MKNSERKIRKKKPDLTLKSYLVSYYNEHSSPFTDRMYHEVKNRVIEAVSKKDAYKYWIENIQTNPSIINIICLDE